MIMAYALFSIANSDEIDEGLQDNEEEGIEVHDFQSRHDTLSCLICRKIKRYKENRPNLIQCVKCKRHDDIRVS